MTTEYCMHERVFHFEMSVHWTPPRQKCPRIPTWEEPYDDLTCKRYYYVDCNLTSSNHFEGNVNAVDKLDQMLCVSVSANVAGRHTC